MRGTLTEKVMGITMDKLGLGEDPMIERQRRDEMRKRQEAESQQEKPDAEESPDGKAEE